MTIRQALIASVVGLLLTGVIGTWTTFDRFAGALRFFLLFSSVAVFLLIGWGGKRRRSSALRTFSLLGMFVSTGTLLAAGAQLTLGLVGGEIGRLAAQTGAWFEVNWPAGVIVVCLPILALEWYAAKEHPGGRAVNRWLGAAALAVLAVAVSGSIASLLVMGLAVVVLAVFTAGQGLARLLSWRWQTAVPVAAAGMAGITAPAALLGWPLILSLRAHPVVSSRFHQAAQAARLVEDFPLVGGGLGSIPGLYAHYIRGLPFFFVPHSHVFYLNVAVELGLLGLAFLLSVFLFTLILLVRMWVRAGRRNARSRLLPTALIASMALLLVLGGIDDPFYGGWALPFLLVVPGLAISYSPPGSALARQGTDSRTVPKVIWVGGLVLVAALAFKWQTATALWFTNLGSVQMARVELAGWPSGQWSDGSRGERLDAAETAFVRVRQQRPNQRTALHRLGLIALERRDFGKAVEYLQSAHRLDPDHRGVRKALGYALVWAGEYAQAENVLTAIPEAREELGEYASWWQINGRPDLARRAGEMLTRLRSG